jgi:hypothetical protein
VFVSLLFFIPTFCQRQTKPKENEKVGKKKENETKGERKSTRRGVFFVPEGEFVSLREKVVVSSFGRKSPPKVE